MPFNFFVPQFIEIEDKIVGPLSFKQLVYLLGGAGGAFLLWRFLPTLVALVLIVPLIGLALALAFYKVNDRPFIIVLGSAIKYAFSNKLYLWKRREKKLEKKKPETKKEAEDLALTQAKALTEGRLKEIAWSLDINENL